MSTTETTTEYLLNKYGRLVMSKTEVAHELNLGLSTISKMMVNNIPLPEYKKMSPSKNARVVFPIAGVAEFMSKS